MRPLHTDHAKSALVLRVSAWYNLRMVMMAVEDAMTQYTPQIGTVSHGTLRPVDLLSAFSSELDMFKSNPDPESKTYSLRMACDNLLAQRAMLDDDPDTGDVADGIWDQEANELIEELADRLSELAPDGCYFGTSEGDASDYGYWPLGVDP